MTAAHRKDYFIVIIMIIVASMMVYTSKITPDQIRERSIYKPWTDSTGLYQP
mgnify:CR=1 FL=1